MTILETSKSLPPYDQLLRYEERIHIIIIFCFERKRNMSGRRVNAVHLVANMCCHSYFIAWFYCEFKVFGCFKDQDDSRS